MVKTGETYYGPKTHDDPLLIDHASRPRQIMIPTSIGQKMAAAL